MNSTYSWLSGLTTITGFGYFVLGFASAYVVHWLRQRRHHKPVRIPWYLAGIAIGTMAIIIVSLQSSVAFNLANQTALEVASCQKNFNMVLRARARISEENDMWSRIQRKALGDWVSAIIIPPPDIAALQENDPADPRIRQWGLEITGHYSRIIQTAQREQDDNIADRAQHPLPDPTCGK